MEAMTDYLKRFEDLDIQDDSGVYQRAKELQENIEDCIARIVEATNLKDEEKIIAAIDDLE